MRFLYTVMLRHYKMFVLFVEACHLVVLNLIRSLCFVINLAMVILFHNKKNISLANLTCVWLAVRTAML